MKGGAFQLLALAAAAVVATASGETSHNNAAVRLCTEPIQFYNDCSFDEKGDSVLMSSGWTLENVKGSPVAVMVPSGCRITLFSKTSATYSSHTSAHGLLIKGYDRVCLKNKLVPTAVQIDHDTDMTALVSQVTGLQSEDTELRKEVSDLTNEMKTLEEKVRSGGLRGPTGAPGKDGLSIVGPTGPRGERGSDGVGSTGPAGPRGLDGKSIVGPKGTDGEPGAPGKKGEKGDQGEKGSDGLGLRLKEFKINARYSKGDYVFAKSSKGGHNSMFIAEKNFVSSKAPSQDVGNWEEFEAPKGEKGDRGEQGEAGPRGVRGTGTPGKDGKDGKSIVGPTGPRGPAGESVVGATGPPGARGEPGESIVGPTGPKGEKGEDAATGTAPAPAPQNPEDDDEEDSSLPYQPPNHRQTSETRITNLMTSNFTKSR